LIGVETGIESIAAVHSQCRRRVKLRHGSKSAPLPLFPLKADTR
jgi:hypothetical protein